MLAYLCGNNIFMNLVSRWTRY